MNTAPNGWSHKATACSASGTTDVLKVTDVIVDDIVRIATERASGRDN